MHRMEDKHARPRYLEPRRHQGLVHTHALSVRRHQDASVQRHSRLDIDALFSIDALSQSLSARRRTWEWMDVTYSPNTPCYPAGPIRFPNLHYTVALDRGLNGRGVLPPAVQSSLESAMQPIFDIGLLRLVGRRAAQALERRDDARERRAW